MQYDEIEVREVERNGEMIIQVDGYNQPRPDSKHTEYRRVVIVGLTEDQAQELDSQLGEILDSR